MKQSLANLGWRRESATTNVNLKGLMQQPWRAQASIPFLAQSHEILLFYSGLEMAILLFMILHGHPGNGLTASFGRIIVTGPDLH